MKKKWLCVLLIFFGLLGMMAISNQVSATSKEVGMGSKERTKLVRFCPIEGIGFIVCPLLDIATAGADGMYDMLSNWVRIDIAILKTNINDPGNAQSESQTSAVWRTFRDIANIIIILAFLVSLTSQVTGFGLSNYQIKKMLPKIIVTVILVNLSLFITELIIDISNIAGDSISGLLEMTTNGLTRSEAGIVEKAAGGGLGLAVVTASFMAANQFAPMLSFIFPVVIVVLLVIISAVILMYARQAIIIMVVVLSPIAFASSIFPNTEKVFKIWKNTLSAVVMVYPIMSLMIGSGKLAGQVLMASNTGGVMTILAAVIQVAPIFFVPSMLQSSMAKVPMVGSFVSKQLGRLNSWGNKKANNSDLVKMQKQKWNSKRLADSVEGRGINGLLNKVPGSYGRNRRHNAEQQYQKEIQQMTNGLSTNDVENWKKYIDGDKDAKKKLSSGAKAMLSLNGGDEAKMSLAIAGAMSKDGNTDPEDYQKMMLDAQKRGVSQDVLTNSNKQNFVKAQASGNIALQASLDHAISNNLGTPQSLNMGMHKNAVYQGYLRKASPNTIANADARSLAKMQSQITNLASSDASFAANLNSIGSGKISSSADVRSYLNGLGYS